MTLEMPFKDTPMRPARKRAGAGASRRSAPPNLDALAAVVDRCAEERRSAALVVDAAVRHRLRRAGGIDLGVVEHRTGEVARLEVGLIEIGTGQIGLGQDGAGKATLVDWPCRNRRR